MKELSLTKLYSLVGFDPNDNQKKAITTIDGPLFLTAGPGSGKTRVLLWRTLNLIVFHKVKPEDIFLSTFTEKAAYQLQEGLKSLLGIVTNENNIPYDISKMSIGTVHSICQKIISDRRFIDSDTRKPPPIVMDELAQYFHFYRTRNWDKYITEAGFKDHEDANRTINEFLTGKNHYSRHNAVKNSIDLFNRFSEECLDISKVKSKDKDLKKLLKMYGLYLEDLNRERIKSVDFALLQQAAYETIISSKNSKNIFKHIIIDEYQDTNTIQEMIFFELAKGAKNICVVGDDDQALYRFRGATVENLVEFKERCRRYLRTEPKTINLDKNYRSREHIVKFYGEFINRIDWKKTKGKGHHRLVDKKIHAHRTGKEPAVIVSEHANAAAVYSEIAEFVQQLKTSGKIEDYSQVAFLFPSIKNSARVAGFKLAFEELDIPVYAPRAGRFLEVDEARLIFGLFLKILGKPKHDHHASSGLRQFQNWMNNCLDDADEVISEDEGLKQFIKDKKAEIETVCNDFLLLTKTINKKKWDLMMPFKKEMARTLASTHGLSVKAVKNLTNKFFENTIEKRFKIGRPFTLKYILNRTSSLDWSILDLFYQLNGFKVFRDMYQLAQSGTDEGPICNLGLITQYLSRFMELYGPVITGQFLNEDKYINTFFSSYSYALFRLGESEYENADDPFPKGRVPFLTIHQAKGLEFPIVVMGSLFKQDRGPSKREEIIRELLQKEGEPLDRIEEFDMMRMFYVALSRAKELLILPRYTKGKAANEVFKDVINNDGLSTISDFKLKQLPKSPLIQDDLGKTYSYTADYLNYLKCPRSYMIFRKYGFVPSRSQTMFFGSLVHKTIEDLHLYLIRQRLAGENK